MTTVSWRRNLAALWVANLVTQFGVYFAQPFLPLFIQRDLGIHGSPTASFRVGMSGSAIGVSLIVAARSGDGWGTATAGAAWPCAPRA
jgi:hypothetical protein